jgi:hypothetical protein
MCREERLGEEAIEAMSRSAPSTTLPTFATLGMTSALS